MTDPLLTRRLSPIDISLPIFSGEDASFSLLLIVVPVASTPFKRAGAAELARDRCFQMRDFFSEERVFGSSESSLFSSLSIVDSPDSLAEAGEAAEESKSLILYSPGPGISIYWCFETTSLSWDRYDRCLKSSSLFWSSVGSCLLSSESSVALRAHAPSPITS